MTNALADNNERIIYDAFVSYSIEGSGDRQFVRNMIAEIEVQQGLRLFVPGRDDLPGSARNTISAYLIERRYVSIVVSSSTSLGPVVQSIVSLTSSLRGQVVKSFTILLPSTLIFLLKK